MFNLLSIVIPVYNEKDLLPVLLAQVQSAELPEGLQRQIIVVDDGSTDGTADVLRRYAQEHAGIEPYFQPANRGKGAAVREGFARARGEIVLIQDADLEYDPAEYGKLLAPILADKADVVFGSRFIGETHRVLYYWHYLGNKLLTMLSNVLTNLNLTDMECCYKVFRREVIDGLKVEEDRFGVEPELTAKVAAARVRIYETPVSYAGRTYAEGKKIHWKDGIEALRCIFQYNGRAIFTRQRRGMSMGQTTRADSTSDPSQ
ncbi:glycosyltransferase family 2 protein [Phycisphaerales bacterium AB-hyl4]|uniref:Glycosyltransferase family 2 protein n=1 Tax=Natronomicrosphaera hydrolytica TaxID=3242702 RepID=A0ABV4U8V6_9BACT